jgi:DNA (cytosine-5)-methyltransferase 1
MPFELSLFSGAGGGLLGTKLLGWRCAGYVENDDYCQRVLAGRIEGGIFDRAPIFRDIRAFLGQGFAERYRGLVDVLTAGFPCPTLLHRR